MKKVNPAIAPRGYSPRRELSGMARPAGGHLHDPLTNPLQLFNPAVSGGLYDAGSLWGAEDHLPRRNLLTYTEYFNTSAYWQVNEVTVSANTAETTDPVGTNTAEKIIETTVNSPHRLSANNNTVLSIPANTPVILTCHFKYGSRQYVGLRMYNADSTQVTCQVFDLQNGTLAAAATSAGWTDVSSNITSVGNGWYRCEHRGTLNQANFLVMPIIHLNSNSAGAHTYAGSTSSYTYLWGAQLSLASTLDQSYQKITDWTTELYAHAARKNVPWLRRNLLTYTEDFSNAYWIKFTSLTNAPSVVANNATAPDGTLTADKITFGAIDASDRISLIVSGNVVSTNRPYAASVYLKAADVNQIGKTVHLYMAVSGDNNSGRTAHVLTADWVRVSQTHTPIASSAATFNIGTLGANYEGQNQTAAIAYVWGAQLSLEECTYQPIATTWEAQYAANAAAAGVALPMYQESTGATAVTGQDTVVGFLGDVAQGNPPYPAIQATAGNRPTLRLSPNGQWYFERSSSAIQLYATFPNLGECSIYTTDDEQMIREEGILVNGSTPILQYAKTFNTLIFQGTTPKGFKLAQHRDTVIYEEADDWTLVGPAQWKRYKQLRAKHAVATKDVLTTPSGTYPSGSIQFLGSVLMADGRVFCVPYASTTARIYDPASDTLSTPTGTFPGTNACCGGALLDSGEIFCAPSGSTTARIYTPNTDTLYTPGGTYHGYQGYWACVKLADGRVFMIMRNATAPRIYDPVTNAVTTLSVTYNGSSKYCCGALLRDGRVFHVPSVSTTALIYDPSINTFTIPTGTYPGNEAYFGSVVLNNGSVYCVPAKTTTARIYNPETDTLTTPTGTFPANYLTGNGTLLPDGRAFIGSFAGTTARIYDPATDTLITPADAYPSGVYQGVTLLLDGRVFSTPYTNTTARIWDGGYPPQSKARCLSAYDNKL